MADRLIAALLDLGATAAKRIPVGDIVVDPRVRLKCRIPLCDCYGHNLMCPPHVPSVAEFREALPSFEAAILIQVSAPLSGDRAEAFVPARKLHDLVNASEKLAFANGFRFAMGLIGGCCRLCDTCTGIPPEGRCRHPFKARPSMEAMGIDVMATIARAGLEGTFPVGERVTWTGLLLL